MNCLCRSHHQSPCWPKNYLSKYSLCIVKTFSKEKLTEFKSWSLNISFSEVWSIFSLSLITRLKFSLVFLRKHQGFWAAVIPGSETSAFKTGTYLSIHQGTCSMPLVSASLQQGSIICVDQRYRESQVVGSRGAFLLASSDASELLGAVALGGRFLSLVWPSRQGLQWFLSNYEKVPSLF